MALVGNWNYPTSIRFGAGRIALALCPKIGVPIKIAVRLKLCRGDDSIEAYANNVFHTWRLGQKGKDNGVLVVVAPNDHKLRIEVGYGLEGTLPDGAAGEIIRTWMTPAFKAGNYDQKSTANPDNSNSTS